MSSNLMLVLAVVLAASPLPVHSKKHFLDASRPRGFGQRGSAGSAREDLHSAVSAALGDGHDIQHGQLLTTRRAIQPMWNSLPKIQEARVDHRMLRYAVHRYFMQTYSVSIVGLEPVHGNGSHSEVTLLAELAESYVKVVLEGQGAHAGFSVEDAVGMIATLERLLLDSGSELLESAYTAMGKRSGREVDRHELLEIFENYMMRWMLGDDQETIEVLESNRTLLKEAVEQWDEIVDFLHGHVKSLEYAWQFQPGRPHGLRQKFAFNDAEVLANGLTLSFGKFWETECAKIKTSLLKMDKDHTGRAKLADFYSTALGGEWRFSESKEYLRELGALDESSPWHGPRVIIPNYLQGPNNCIIAAPHYRVCCMNECEDVLLELEVALGGSIATPEEVLRLVRNMSATLDDEVPDLVALEPQLRQIAKMHNGKVPLHGRLFAQWLHYAFPRECAFPHKSGTISRTIPLKFGDNYAATDKDMEMHVADGNRPRPEPVDDVEKEWMSQWTDEEELLSENVPFHAPWESKQAGSVLMLFCGACLLAIMWGRLNPGQSEAGACLLESTDAKIHLI